MNNFTSDMSLSKKTLPHFLPIKDFKDGRNHVKIIGSFENNRPIEGRGEYSLHKYTQ